MDLQLTGRRALVTGSSSGIGRTTAEFLAAEGATVVVHGRDEARVEATATAVRDAGGEALTAVGDLTTDAGADAVAAAAGDVDIVVNNAGAYDHIGWEADAATWAAFYEQNVISAVRVIERLTPDMRARGWGRVVQIGGGLASQPLALSPHYNATLAARHNLAVSLARELAGTGVTSNIVSPGAVLVPALREVLASMAADNGWGTDPDEIERNAAAALIPNDIGRFGRPEDVAGAVAFLCSPFADYVSGATIRVDGGTIRGAF